MENEVRLIDANALQRRICKAKCNREYEDCRDEGDCEFDFFIFWAPTIDPDSLRPKGRWELHGNDDDCGCSYFCSNCGRSYPEDWFYNHGQYVPFENCPHCTAKMEG